MGSFRSIFFIITTFFSLTYCSESPFASSIPVWFDSITSLATGVLKATPRAFTDFRSEYLKVHPLTEKISQVSRDVFDYMATLLSSLTRRTTLMRPNVEMGPGAFKPEILKYPEDYFVNRLKTLLKIKKREEEMNKPLNKT